MEQLLAGQGQLDSGDGQHSGILPSNSSYRPTRGAIRHNEDTEFNDALRARGILPPKATGSRSPSPPASSSKQAKLQARLETADLSDDDELLAFDDDDIPPSILEKYRSQRMDEVQKLQKTRRYGSVLPIGRENYTREINEASEQDVDEDNEDLKGKGTGVVCFLWKYSIPESQLMAQHLDKLATAYPSTKFVSIRGDMCIANYPDKNIPTLLLYRRGQLARQVVGMGRDVGMKGMQTTVLDVEALLTLCDSIDPFLKVAPTEEKTNRDDDDDGSDDSDSGRKQGQTNRRTLGVRGGRNQDDDDDDDDDLDI